jgi:hypothetical protein
VYAGGAAHRNERKRAARVDRDERRAVEEGAGAVAEASSVGAGERGGHPGGDVDATDAVVGTVLRCSTWEGPRTEKGS